VPFLFLDAAHLASQVNEPQVPLARAGEGEVETEWTTQGLPPEFAGESTMIIIADFLTKIMRENKDIET
jgi:hypothetical protein